MKDNLDANGIDEFQYKFLNGQFEFVFLCLRDWILLVADDICCLTTQAFWMVMRTLQGRLQNNSS